jgi:hypothetical protein
MVTNQVYIAISLGIWTHMQDNDGALTHIAYLEIVCNERPEFTLEQPPGEREHGQTTLDGTAHSW